MAGSVQALPPRWLRRRMRPTQVPRRTQPMRPMPRWRTPHDSRRTRTVRPMRLTTHARKKPDAHEKPPTRATSLMRMTYQLVAVRPTRQRQAARQERKSATRPRATRTRQRRGQDGAASQMAASGWKASYVRSHRPIRPPHGAVAGGASSARAIDTSGASRAPGADASSRRSRSLMQRVRSDGG